MIALGIVAGLILMYYCFKKKGLKTEHIINISLIVLPCAILGARIYYCVFFANDYTFANFFDLSSGGLAVYGSIIGGALAVIMYCLIAKLNFFKVADCIVPSLAIGQCIGRIGCYFGGCCYGEETSLHFFPLSVEIDGVWRLATFFYESFATLIICLILIFLIRHIRVNGLVFAGYFLLYGLARFFIEGVRGDSLYFLGFRVSQLLSVLLVLCSVIYICFILIRKTKAGKFGEVWGCVNAQRQEMCSQICKKDNTCADAEISEVGQNHKD